MNRGAQWVCRSGDWPFQGCISQKEGATRRARQRHEGLRRAPLYFRFGYLCAGWGRTPVNPGGDRIQAFDSRFKFTQCSEEVLVLPAQFGHR